MVVFQSEVNSSITYCFTFYFDFVCHIFVTNWFIYDEFILMFG